MLDGRTDGRTNRQTDGQSFNITDDRVPTLPLIIKLFLPRELVRLVNPNRNKFPELTAEPKIEITKPFQKFLFNLPERTIVGK